MPDAIITEIPALTKGESEELRGKIKRAIKQLAFDIAAKRLLMNTLEDTGALVDMFLFCKSLLDNIHDQDYHDFKQPDLRKKVEAYLSMFSDLKDLRKLNNEYIQHTYDKDYYKNNLYEYIHLHHDNMVRFIYFVVRQGKIFSTNDDDDEDDD